MALTLADGLCDIGISLVYQHDTLTINREGGHMTENFQWGQIITILQDQEVLMQFSDKTGITTCMD